MKKILTLVLLAGGLGFSGCAGEKAPAMDPMDEVKKLMTLYQEARPKFVVQKQEMIQADDCSRATRLREAIDQLAEEAAMSPEKNVSITMVQMELQQAEKDCLAK